MVFDYGPISCYMLGLGLRSGSAKVISHDSHTRHSNFRDYSIIIQVSCINIKKTFTFFCSVVRFMENSSIVRPKNVVKRKSTPTAQESEKRAEEAAQIDRKRFDVL